MLNFYWWPNFERVSFFFIQTLLISIIFYVVPESQECGLERIAPLKQNSEGSWIDLNSNEVADLDGMWLQGQPNGKDIQNCATFFASTGK